MDYSLTDLLKLLGSLGFFLFGMKLMSESLQKVAGDRMRSILSAMTSTRLKGVFTGFLITAIIQSSSATTVMLVSFVNAGLITFTESIGVVMGSNIGTTVTAWLISILGFKVKMSYIVLPLIGITFPLLFSKNANRNNWGQVIMGFAIIFIGLDFLKDATPDINSNPEILQFLSGFSDYGLFSILIFILIGTVLTMIIQSSSATMALTLVMCFNGWVTFEMAAAMVLGQNLGTTITANLAALVANTSAKRTAMAHMFFNLIGIILILPFFTPFLELISSISEHYGYSPIANDSQTAEATAKAIPIALSIFHTVFNILNTLILVWFVKPIEKFIIQIVKQKEDDEEFKLQFISTGLLSTIDLSILQAKKELIVFTERVEKMFGRTRRLIASNTPKEITHLQEKIAKSEDISDQFEVEISSYLAEVSKQILSQNSVENINRILQTTTQIESIADACYAISKNITRKNSLKIEFNEKMTEDLISYSDLVTKKFNMMIELIKDEELRIDIADVKSMMDEIRKAHETLQKEHFRNIKNGVYKTKVGVIYADIYAELQRIADLSNHVIRLLQSLDGAIHE